MADDDATRVNLDAEEMREVLNTANEQGLLLFHDSEARIIKCRFCLQAVALSRLEDHFEERHPDQIATLNQRFVAFAEDAARAECEVESALRDKPCRRRP